MDKNFFLYGLLRLLTDFISVVLGWAIAFLIRPYSDLIPGIHIVADGTLPALDFYIPFTIFSSIGAVIIFSSLGLYIYPIKYINFSIFWKLFWGIFLWVLGVLAVYGLILHDLFFSRIMLAHAGIFSLFFCIILRYSLGWIFQSFFNNKKQILVIGNEKEQDFFRRVFHDSEFSIAQVSFPEKINLEKIKNTVSEIFFFEGEKRHQSLKKIREYSAEKGKVLNSIPEYAAEFWGHAKLDIIRGVPIITSTPFAENLWWFASKRTFDILFSLFFLVLFAPLFLCIAVAIRIDSVGKIFYISERVGRNGNIFHIWKFRSMEENAEDKKNILKQESHRDGPLFKMKNDPRITRIGKFLRRTSLDEIPQFINVLKGEMSVIGPRPHLFSEIEQYQSSQKRVLSVKPGISGLAQVSGRSDLKFSEEIFLDAFYAENSSFFLDMKIFFKTPFILLAGKGAD